MAVAAAYGQKKRKKMKKNRPLSFLIVNVIFGYVFAGLLRCGKSCRLRWTNYLRPDLKRGLLSESEEKMVIDLHAQLGNRLPSALSLTSFFLSQKNHFQFSFTFSIFISSIKCFLQ